MASEPIPKVLLDRNPDLPAILTAIEEFKANKPVTQRSSKTGELMSVKEDKELGVLIVICDGRVVYRSRRTPSESPETSASRISVNEKRPPT
ncbi:MAG TPA: hypothetical protein VNN62_01935 [Methylomirabilota bacterium]|jgi:hypothetical protein|nr:hypothetical protein [Methylomirabilota bacterium]HZT35101.1 hypothetical protein [Nitrososphaera sp.]